MKNIILLFLFLPLMYSLDAQVVDVKFNPLSLVFKTFSGSAEGLVRKNIGIEFKYRYQFDGMSNIEELFGTSVGFKIKTSVYTLMGKRYFNENPEWKGIYVGGYGQYKMKKYIGDFRLGYGEVNRRLGSMGAVAGFKFVSKLNFLFEGGIGAGFRFYNEIEIIREGGRVYGLEDYHFEFPAYLSVGFRF